MRIRLKNIKRVLEDEGYKVLDADIPPVHGKDLYKAGLLEEIVTIFHELGGIGEELPLRIPEYDLECNNIIFQLDDELQFNRYRNITLRSVIYDHLPDIKIENFKRYGRQFEKECLKAGIREGVWSSRHSEKYFGPSGEPGDFFGNGSSGWKLMAFQSFIQDVRAYIYQKRIVRIAIYDNLMIEGKLQRLDKILDTSQNTYKKILTNYFSRLIHQSHV
jgi:hypothetical protein